MTQTAHDFIASGDTLASAKNYAAACLDYGRALNLIPRNGEASFKLAEALQHIGKSIEAIPYFLTALQSNPENTPYILGLGQAMFQTGEQDRVSSFYATVSKNQPGNEALRLASEQLPVTPSIADRFSGFITKCPADNLDAMMQTVLGHIKSGEHELAYTLGWELVWAAPMRFQVWNILTVTARSVSTPHLAEACARRAIALNPSHVQNWLNLNWVIRDDNRNDDAEHVLLEAIKYCGQQWPLINELCGIFLNQDRSEEVLSLLDNLENKSDYSPDLLARLKAEAIGKTRIWRCPIKPR